MTDLHAEPSSSFSPAKGKPGQLHRLMEAYVDGDERAFGQLHVALEPRLRARLSRLVRDAAVVDDLVQLTFLRAHAARDRFAAGHGGFPLVGTPDHVADELEKLSQTGLAGTTLAFVDYAEEFPYFRDEVIPRLERKGLRKPFNH